MSLIDILKPPAPKARKGRVVSAKRELDQAVKERLAAETDEAVKARTRAYMAKPEVKARTRAYMAKPEVKARTRASRIEERIERLKAELCAARKIAGVE